MAEQEEQRDISQEPVVLMAVVTVRIKPKKQTSYTSIEKQTGICPLSEKLGYQILCNDVNGEHHSFTLMGYNADEIERKAKKMFTHITRIEILPSVVD